MRSPLARRRSGATKGNAPLDLLLDEWIRAALCDHFGDLLVSEEIAENFDLPCGEMFHLIYSVLPSSRFFASIVSTEVSTTMLAKKVGKSRRAPPAKPSAQKKRRGPAPTGKGTQVVVRLQPRELERVDAYVATQADEPSRAEALRRMAGFEPAPVKRSGRRAYVRPRE
jgi:hypothetical protein